MYSSPTSFLFFAPTTSLLPKHLTHTKVSSFTMSSLRCRHLLCRLYGVIIYYVITTVSSFTISSLRCHHLLRHHNGVVIYYVITTVSSFTTLLLRCHHLVHRHYSVVIYYIVTTVLSFTTSLLRCCHLLCRHYGVVIHYVITTVSSFLGSENKIALRAWRLFFLLYLSHFLLATFCTSIMPTSHRATRSQVPQQSQGEGSLPRRIRPSPRSEPELPTLSTVAAGKRPSTTKEPQAAMQKELESTGRYYWNWESA